MGARERPSLWRLSTFALTWQVSLWLGWGLLLLGVVQFETANFSKVGYALEMIAALVIFGELRPVVASDTYAQDGVPISTAFVFATLYMWGFAPAVILQAVAVLLSEIVQRKEIWKLVFNVGQYVMSVSAAWLVMSLGGVTPTLGHPTGGIAPSDVCLLYTSPSPRDGLLSRMPSSA